MGKKNKIQTLLKIIIKNKKRIIAYGASDKGTVFMNCCKISNNEVAVIDLFGRWSANGIGRTQ